MSVPDFAARPQLAEDVARFVRRRIFDGSYAAGAYVRLDQLAAELGVSVTPVREALFELKAEGLLDQQPRRLAARRLAHLRRKTHPESNVLTRDALLARSSFSLNLSSPLQTYRVT